MRSDAVFKMAALAFGTITGSQILGALISVGRGTINLVGLIQGLVQVVAAVVLGGLVSLAIVRPQAPASPPPVSTRPRPTALLADRETVRWEPEAINQKQEKAKSQ